LILNIYAGILMSSPSIWYDIFIAGAIAKFICFIISARWPGGSKGLLKTWRGRLVYFGGKITPLIAIGAVLVYYKLIHPSIEAWWLALAFVALLLYDGYVVWRRLTNRRHGFGTEQKFTARELQDRS
jgi:hypothetical protein